MDSILFWIFLWLIPSLSLNKIKIKPRFLLFVVPQHVASPITPFHDLTLIVLMDVQSLFQLTLPRLLSLLVEPQLCPYALRLHFNRALLLSPLNACLMPCGQCIT
jgi:hypothetical protein